MAIHFSCPRCYHTIRVLDEHAGMQVKCPLCDSVVAAPAGAESSAAPPEAEQPAPRMSPPSDPTVEPEPREVHRKRMVVLAIRIGGIGLIALLAVALFMPLSVRSPRSGLSPRTICGANLRSLSLCFISYANENDGAFPTPWHERSDADLVGNVYYVEAIGSYRSVDVRKWPDPPAQISTTRAIWEMIRIECESPKALICPSSEDEYHLEDDLMRHFDFGVGEIDGPATADQVKQAYSQISYGYQVPFGRYQLNANSNGDLPLAADKGPYSAHWDGGLQAPPAITVTSADDDEDWQPFNSPNHDGEGQNVVYVDGHVEWHFKPTAGVDNDNIYTQQRTFISQPTDIEAGNAPAPGAKLTPARETDTLIYP